jgi:hypothetical protein
MAPQEIGMPGCGLIFRHDTPGYTPLPQKWFAMATPQLKP